MPQVLELSQLVDQNRMAQVKIWGRRIESGLYPERAPLPELLNQPFLGDQLIHAAFDNGQRLINRCHVPHTLNSDHLGRTTVTEIYKRNLCVTSTPVKVYLLSF